MKEHQRLVLRSSDLPKIVEVIGNNGERAFYKLSPAGRKFGASLQGIDEPLKRMLQRESTGH